MKENLFKPETLEKIKKMRRIFLWAAVWILIGELALGAVLILAQSWNVSVAKIQGVFLVLVVALFISVNNFIRMERGDKKIQVFALIGFISNIIWSLIAILLILEAVPYYWVETNGRYFTWSTYHLSFWMMLEIAAASAAGAGFWISNTMAIKETTKIVKPLKITAIVCVVYCWAFSTVMAFSDLDYSSVSMSLYQLSGFAALGFVVTTLAAFIISRTNDKDSKKLETGVKVKAGKSDDELRAEIEEKVRREMIEKEIRDKYAAEKKSSE